MGAQTVPASNPAVDKEARIAALRRATVRRIVDYRTPHHGTYHVTSADRPEVEHSVTTCGPRRHELAGTCPGARHGRVYLHMTDIAFARRHHVNAARRARPAQADQLRRAA
jgi:hypothetical protein